MSIFISYNLAKYRKINKLTQQELSDNLKDVSKPAIALYEKNKRTPSEEIQKRICNELNISVAVLNGKEQLELYKNKIRSKFLENKVTYNDYIYIYNFIVDFYDFDVPKDVNKQSNILNYSLEDISRRILVLPSMIKKYSTDIYSKDIEKANKLIEYITFTFNLLIDMALLLLDEKHIMYDDKAIYNYKIIEEVDRELANVLVELKPYFISILDSLNSIETIQDYSIPVFYESISKIIDYILITPNYDKQTSTLSAIKIKDDYMCPRFDKNDIVIVKQYNEYNTGDYIAISSENEKISIGKLKLENEFVVLQPLNTSYTPNIFIKKNCKIIGKIIETRYNN